MIRIQCLAALILSLSATSALAAPKDEMLAAPDLPGFVVAHSQSGSVKSFTVEVPDGETRGNWSRSVTTQWFRGLADDMTPTEYVEKIVERLPKSCPGAVASPVQTSTQAGYNSAQFKVICPRSANGISESFVLLAIAGKDDMFVKQVAFARKASAEDFLWARKYLSGVTLCRTRAKSGACR